ncbi:hypothetical protein [Oceanobacillus salinisoli]|nr:hypothetical protein [Oceanobacillus salinisoli]
MVEDRLIRGGKESLVVALLRELDTVQTFIFYQLSEEQQFFRKLSIILF